MNFRIISRLSVSETVEVCDNSRKRDKILVALAQSNIYVAVYCKQYIKVFFNKYYEKHIFNILSQKKDVEPT